MDIRSDSLFYAFVCLKRDSSQPPDVFIVPSHVVAQATEQALKLKPILKRLMFWIPERAAENFQERWDLITERLMPVEPVGVAPDTEQDDAQGPGA